MKQSRFILFMLAFALCSCQNKELAMEDPCDPMVAGWRVLARVNWEDHERDSRQMRMSLFSQNHHPHLDRETIDGTGLKYVTIPIGSHYMPICYDYYARNIYFRNETDYENVEAYSISSSRATYRSRATPVEGEETVSEPGTFHVHAWDGAFKLEEIPNEGEEVVIDFYPVDVLREFTFCIRNVVGAENISQSRGAISGLAASMFLATGALNPRRSTVLFENASASNEDVGEITGRFYTFGPIEPYVNRFTIEVMSVGDMYFTHYWDVSQQIGESMADRDAKLARDGYDILIINDVNDGLPPIPGDDTTVGDPAYGSGFHIDVGEWDDVVIYL
jgi:hypothetical protein